jgi:uncharacterized protein
MPTILVDINHPAHVHLFKHFIYEMKKKGYRVLVTAKEVKVIMHLLEVYGIDYIKAGKKKDSLFLKYFYEFFHLVKVAWLVLKHRVDFGLGISMVLPILSRFTSMKVVALDDDDLTATPIFGKAISFATLILNPSSLSFEDRGPNRVCHPSFHELAYLHPARFVPQPQVLKEAGLREDEPFFIMRFNVFKAHHDTGAKGLNLEQKLQVIDLLKPFGRIFITTERDIEPELKEYQMPVAPEKIHSLMYYATLFVGDSQTMISEAAILGTPAVKLNSFAGRLSIPNEIEHRYGLCYSYLPEQFEDMMARVASLVMRPDLKSEWKVRQQKMLEEKIDLTTFLIWLISEYPASFQSVKHSPDFQFQNI